METIIGMVLAFVLGAITARFDDFMRFLEYLEAKEKPKNGRGIIVNDAMSELIKEQEKLDKERMEQFFNAMYWNGKQKEIEDEE